MHALYADVAFTKEESAKEMDPVLHLCLKRTGKNCMDSALLHDEPLRQQKNSPAPVQIR